MAKKSSSIAEYISWLLKQYNEVKKQTSRQTVYRLVKIKEKSANGYELSFQLIGKANIFKSTPEDLLKNEKVIELFSCKDISTITQLACITQFACKNPNPSKKIIGTSFSEKLGTLLFRIKNLNKNEINEYTASKLSSQKELIKDLSPEDAHTIGYAAAQEEHQTEKNTINFLRSHSKK